LKQQELQKENEGKPVRVELDFDDPHNVLGPYTDNPEYKQHLKKLKMELAEQNK
jgi:hypothetical protein